MGKYVQGEEFTGDLVGCARCHGDGHPGLVFRPFTRPVKSGVEGSFYTHWAMCPALGEPILLRMGLRDEEAR